MIFALLVIISGIWFFGRFKDNDAVFRERYAFISKFITQYEQRMGIRLTYDQAVALVQVTMATMRKSRADRVYLEEGYPAAQKLTESLCEEAERKVNNRHDR